MKYISNIIIILIIILSTIISSLGLFYTTKGKSYQVINQYGDLVNIYGDGIYKHDSFFMATIFKGTDFSILFIGVPLLIAALFFNIRKQNIKTALFLISILSIFTYYSTSISFGVTYNILHLLYIALFSLCFFGLIMEISKIKYNNKLFFYPGNKIKGLNIFLIICGCSLFIAWLPDIILSLIKKKSLLLIEIYTTQITYVLDMGIISPSCFICLYLIKNNNNFGFILLAILLTLFAFVGIMVPIQTLFQYYHGLFMPLSALISKVVIFIIFAIIAIYYNIILFTKISVSNNS